MKKKIASLITTIMTIGLPAVIYAAPLTKEELSNTMYDMMDGGITVVASILLVLAIIQGVMAIINYGASKEAGGDAEKTSAMKGDIIRAVCFILAASLVHFPVRALILKIMGLG